MKKLSKEDIIVLIIGGAISLIAYVVLIYMLVIGKNVCMTLGDIAIVLLIDILSFQRVITDDKKEDKAEDI